MSKELPYFQFEPGAYLTGDITLCSIAAQGIYVNLIALYWQKDCKLGLSKAKARLGHSECFDELINDGIIKVDGDSVSIDFLDEQREFLSNRKKRLSEAGRKGGKAKRKQGLSDVKATPKHLEEKRRIPSLREDIEKKEMSLPLEEGPFFFWDTREWPTWGLKPEQDELWWTYMEAVFPKYMGQDPGRLNTWRRIFIKFTTDYYAQVNS